MLGLFICLMRSLLFLLVFCSTIIRVSADSNPVYALRGIKDRTLDDDVRMRFGHASLFMDNVRLTDNNGSKTNVVAPGLSFTYIEGWGEEDRSANSFSGGGYIRILMGYSHSKAKRWLPYEYSCGALGSYVFNNTKHEFGFDYGMLGIYGYSAYAFFGSNLALKYRYSRFQLEVSRGGDGIFRGFIVPRFETKAVHSVGLGYIFKNNKFLGYKRTFVPSNGAGGYVAKENRLLFSFNMY